MTVKIHDAPAVAATRGVVLHRAAAVYDILSPAMLFWRENKINRRAVARLKLRLWDRVLDVGCATGNATLAAAKGVDAIAGGLVVGIDASLEMIGQARRKIKDRPCRFDMGVAESLPYADATFDKALSTFFFHHLDLADKLRSLREIYRVLKTDGVLVVVDVDVPTSWLGKTCARSGQWIFHQPELEENIQGKLPGLFIQAGFASVERVGHDLGYITTFLLRK
jgi:ubiquinone/menaquinone biosynthesis C-methylase UbiE